MPAILAQQLVKHYTPDIRAVDGIDLSVDQGKIFAFLGVNGSGKTTTALGPGSLTASSARITGFAP